VRRRALRAARAEDKDTVRVVDGGGGGADDGGDVGEGQKRGQGRSFRAVEEMKTKRVTSGGGRRSDGAKGFFGGVLEFGGGGAARKQVVESGDTGREDIVYVREVTRGSGGPWDTYARSRGIIPSVGVVISIQGVIEFKGVRHCAAVSLMKRLSKCEEPTTGSFKLCGMHTRRLKAAQDNEQEEG
jgi:hypothetical protein